MFNLKFIASLDSSSKEKLVAALTEFVTDVDLRISLYNHGSFDRAKQFFDANIHRISDSKLKALYEEAAGRGWENKIQKVIKEKKKIAELESNERIQALTRTAENQKRQNDLQKEVEVLKNGLAQDIVSFLQKNPTKSLNDFDFSTYEAVWNYLNKESDNDTYTNSSFNNFLNTIDVYVKNIGTVVHTPQAPVATSQKGDEKKSFGSVIKNYLTIKNLGRAGVLGVSLYVANGLFCPSKPDVNSWAGKEITVTQLLNELERIEQEIHAFASSKEKDSLGRGTALAKKHATMLNKLFAGEVRESTGSNFKQIENRTRLEKQISLFIMIQSSIDSGSPNVLNLKVKRNSENYKILVNRALDLAFIINTNLDIAFLLSGTSIQGWGVDGSRNKESVERLLFASTKQILAISLIFSYLEDEDDNDVQKIKKSIQKMTQKIEKINTMLRP